MTLTCPHCEYSKEIDPARIPDTVKKVVCPRCKESFTLSDVILPTAVATDALSEPVVESAIVPPTESATIMPAINAPTAANPAELPKAGFWIRTVAALLDSLLAWMIQFVFSFILGMTASNLMNGMDPRDSVAVGLLTSLASLVLGITYSVFFIGYCGQTPGKMVLRIKVIRTSGEDIGYGRAFLREVPGKFLSGILLGIGYLMVAFDEKKQGLHDRIADTYVVKL